METPQDVCHPIRAGDWAASIDLRDAYFHISIHAEDRKFLRFGWRGRLFQFCVLPFGLSPGGFHDKVFACLWALSFSFILILESSLSSKNFHSSHEEDQGQVGLYRHQINLLSGQHLGPGIHLPQLHGQSPEGPLAADQGGLYRQLGEVQSHPYDQLHLPGDDLGLGQGRLESPQDKLLLLHNQASLLLNCPFPSCRQVMVLTWLVAAFHKAVPLFRLKVRFVQLSLNSYFSAQNLLKMVTLLPEVRRYLLWMTQLQIQDRIVTVPCGC
jgi:hypothetical protein